MTSQRLNVTLLIGLIALAFTTITAGADLLQQYYSALGLSLANCPFGLSGCPADQIVTQVNLWFPVGQFLITFGLAIVFSIFVKFFLYVWPSIRQANRKFKLLLLIGVFLPFLPIIPPNSENLRTVQTLWTSFTEHWDVFWIFVGLSIWFSVALTIRRK